MENEDKFFSAIEDTLHSYEDAYPAGAWEDFREKRKRRKALVLFFRLGSAAVVLLFLSYATIQLFKKDTVPAQVAQTKNISREQKNDTLQPTRGVNNNDALVTSNKAVSQNKNNENKQQIGADKQDVATTRQGIITPAKESAKAGIVQKATVAEKDNAIIANVIVPDKTAAVNSNINAAIAGDTVKAVNGITTTNVIAKTEVKKYTGSTKSVYDSIFNSKTNKVATVADRKNQKNLSYGVVVSPALGNQKFNFGTGVEVAYKINKNFFVSSGIAYSSLNATGGGALLTAAPPGAASSGRDVSLQVSGFEVPIGLQYRTDNGFYVSAGIVAMGVTNNKLEYNYIAQTTAAVSTLDAAGVAQNSLKIVNEPKTEQSKEKIQNYLGFYMMSIGKKKKIGNNQLTFGPFVRVPFGAVSSQKISLFQGGITLGFDF
ncbi:hypothetical protein [Mucilaginibacter sp. UYCu711]|uniref:hypothetical protein n=1 Tax=Mucilaginibacter sp. UYCu711 TaxID=3156339 RepID=UPI003D2143A4